MTGCHFSPSSTDAGNLRVANVSGKADSIQFFFDNYKISILKQHGERKDISAWQESPSGSIGLNSQSLCSNYKSFCSIQMLQTEAERQIKEEQKISN